MRHKTQVSTVLATVLLVVVGLVILLGLYVWITG